MSAPDPEVADVPRVDALATVAGLNAVALRRAVRRVQEDPAGAAAAIAAADARDAAELADRRRQYRWAAYERTRPAGYEHADLARLTPDQDPDRRVSGWWRSGSKTLLLSGRPGRGKTEAAFAVCNQVASDDRDGHTSRPVLVQAWRAADLRDLLQPMDRQAARDDAAWAERGRRIRDLEWCDLLLLDDLTAVKVTEWFREELHLLLDKRVTTPGRRTIVTVNADEKKSLGQELASNLGAAIVSRLRDGCSAAWIDGPDMRTHTTWDPFTDGETA